MKATIRVPIEITKYKSVTKIMGALAAILQSDEVKW